MIRPTAEELLRGVCQSLEADVLPVLAKGYARNQLKASLHLLNRLSRSVHKWLPALLADNRDFLATIRVLVRQVGKNEKTEEELRALSDELDSLDVAPEIDLSADDIMRVNSRLQEMAVRVSELAGGDREIGILLRALFQRSNQREILSQGDEGGSSAVG